MMAGDDPCECFAPDMLNQQRLSTENYNRQRATFHANRRQKRSCDTGVYWQASVLRQQLETEKCKVQVDGQQSALLERMTAMFSSDSISFDEYDDVVVRRLVECIRVMKDKRIVVVLKGGLQTEEMIA